jgi:Homoserine dehydrogenase
MKVAVLGFGTVGFGVYEMLKGAEGLEPGPVLVRPGKDDEDFKVTFIESITDDQSVDAVAEVMGGVEPAFSYVSAALKAGKHVVTSNKALVAAKGIELQQLATENNVGFLFSAACGGAIPFLHNMALAVESDEMLSVGGILNGTTNYMLDGMQRRNLTYGDALSDAQRLGYAEADPTADVSGLDALRKIMLACAVAYNILPSDGLNNEGIDSFTAEDVEYIQSLNLTCRLIASGGKNENDSVYAYVEPVLFSSDAIECSVNANFNMAKYNGENSGPIVMIGQGAGRWPTASAVIRDLSDITHGRRIMMRSECKGGAADNSLCSHKYLVRIPADLNISLPVAESNPVNGVRYVVTEPVSVSSMHGYANNLRKDGINIFFAAIG